MTIEKIENLEKELEECGYRKITGAKIQPRDDYEWYCAFRDEDNEVIYQIFYCFWDWRKYSHLDISEPMSVDIIISGSNTDYRCDLQLGEYRNRDIKEIEAVAEKFYTFAKENNLL